METWPFSFPFHYAKVRREIYMSLYERIKQIKELCIMEIIGLFIVITGYIALSLGDEEKA